MQLPYRIAGERVRGLVSGLPSSRRRIRRFMAFQAYMDESGSGSKEGPIFMLSGYISPYYWWEDFSDLWQSMLDGPPALGYFKMREAATLSGQFENWKFAKRTERVAKAIDLIKRVAHASLSCAIPLRLHERIIKNRVPTNFDSPAFLAIFDVMTKAVENQLSIKAENPSEPVEPVDFIFDEHKKWQTVVPAAYLLWRRISPPEYQAMMGDPPIFRDDKQFLPLQASDLQSWYFRKVIAEKLRGEPFPKGLPKETFAPLDKIPSLMSVWDRRRLQFLADSVNSGRTESMRYDDAWPKRVANIHDMLEYIDLEDHP